MAQATINNVAKHQAAVAAKQQKHAQHAQAVAAKQQAHQTAITAHAAAVTKRQDETAAARLAKQQAKDAAHAARLKAIADRQAAKDAANAPASTVLTPQFGVPSGTAPLDASGATATTGGYSGLSAVDSTVADSSTPAPTKSGGSGSIPLWLKITGGVVGVVGLYGYIKYRQVTAPFRYAARVLRTGKALHAAIKG